MREAMKSSRSALRVMLRKASIVGAPLMIVRMLEGFTRCKGQVSYCCKLRRFLVSCKRRKRLRRSLRLPFQHLRKQVDPQSTGMERATLRASVKRHRD